MNQKRIITNQILEQKNFTLNSTLNYLFNISNMKKLFSYLLISSMVILSSCTNYDDQFDDLNAQINTLKSQIEGFSSLSTGLTALQGTVSSLQTAVAALPKTATPATDISGLVTSSATNATSIAALQTALDALSKTLAAMQTTLAGAATAADIKTLNTELDLVQADLTELLASNNIYTGDVIVNNAATLKAVEQLGNKVGIVNGNVYVTQSATNGVDAAKLQAVVSKITTVTGAVSYTHSGASVVAVGFTALTSAGSVSLVQDAPISLPVLASSGATVLKSNAAPTKLTSVSAPLLATVTSLNNGVGDKVGGGSVTSIDMGSLVRYPNDLDIQVSTTGDTTIDFASLTSTDGTTGLQKSIAIVLTGGDDLTLPLVATGSVTANTVKNLTLPMLTFTGANVTTATAKLETLALHKVDGDLVLTDYNNLSSIDIIGVVREASVANKTVNGTVTISGSTTDLVTASFAGTLESVSIAGATDLTTITTSGMIRSFSLDGSNDITSLTLGHAGITGVTGTNAAAINNTNAGQLVINNNDNLVSFSATNIATLGKLHITDNDELTSFDLKSTLGLGVQPEKGLEVVDVKISGNKLSGSVQTASPYNYVPVTTGKITQPSLANIKTYLAAVEAAILGAAISDATTGDDKNGYVRATAVQTIPGAYGGAVTGYTLTNAIAQIDAVTSITDYLGVGGVASATTNWDVIKTVKGDANGGVPGVTRQEAKGTISFGPGTYVLGANGGSKSFTVADATATANLATITNDPLWTAYGVGIVAHEGIDNRTEITIGGSVSATDSITIQGGPSDVHSVTYGVASNGQTAATTAGGLVTLFNAYVLGAASATTEDAEAIVVGNSVVIFAGTYSGTDGLTVNIKGGDYHAGLEVDIAALDSSVSTPTATIEQVSDYALTITATDSSTATSVQGLGILTPTGVTAVKSATTSHAILTTGFSNDEGMVAEPVPGVTAGTPATAIITKRSIWL